MQKVHAALIGLTHSVEAWEAALLLYETSRRPPAPITRSVASRWRFIACNECILELYHLRWRFDKIRSVQLRACPSLQSMIEPSILRSACKRLDEYFPDIEALRHATAHRGENEAHSEEHSHDGQFALSGFRELDRYSTPYKGALRYLDITSESLARITEVVDMFLSAFEPAARELQRQGHLDD